MDEVIQQLTHDNALFIKEWPDICDRITNTQLPHDAKLVLNALVNYLLADSIDSELCHEKHVMITNVIAKLVDGHVSIEAKDLINAFTHILDSGKINKWYLHFLETIYRKFQIGELLCSETIQIDLIEKILQSLRNQSFIFNLKADTSKWNRFLTETIFSSSIDKENILNKQSTVEKMEITFQQFYKHAIQQSEHSKIWLNISTLFHESSSDIFNNNLTWDMILTDMHLSNKNVSSGYINHLIQSDDVDPELIKKHNTKLITIIEHLILANNYNDAHILLSKFIILNLESINLEVLFCTLIRLCPLVEDKNLFYSRILKNIVMAIENNEIQKSLAFVCFDLSLSILKLKIDTAPDLAHRLLSKSDFYPWKDLMNGLVDLVQTCISYDTIIHEECFSELDRLENIIELIHRKAQNYPAILKVIHPIAIETILRWSNAELHGNIHVHRMGNSLLNCIVMQLVDEDLCIKFIDIIQKKASGDNENLNVGKTIFLDSMARSLSNIISQLKRLSYDAHLKLATLFFSLLDYSLYDEDHNMTFQYLVLTNLLFQTVSTIANEDDARLYEPFMNRMFANAKTDGQAELYRLWVHFWLIVGGIVQNVAVDHIEQFFDYIISQQDTSLASLVLTLSIQYIDKVKLYLNNIVDMLLLNNGQFLTSCVGLFAFIVQKSPDTVTPDNIDKIFSSIDAIPFNHDLCILIQALGYVTYYKPFLFDKHWEKLISLINEKRNLLIFECFRKYIISSVIYKNDENKANEYLNLLMDLLKNKNHSEEMQKDIFYTFLLIGVKYRNLLATRRDEFVRFNCSLLINYIDDITNSQLDQCTIRQAQVEIEQIERCLQKTKTHQTIEDTNINNIPAWSSQVAKLLNLPSNNDWRLLAKQLGFSPSEIRYWAIQRNPCMTLLNEWFATHTLDQAIYGIVSVLNEIGRYDVEKIIREEALKTGQIIPNDCSINIKRLPSIMLSFHSSEQNRVDKLKEHLEQVGYTCQMCDDQCKTDVLQSYIRGTKVIVFCINTYYEQSDTCSKLCYSILTMKKPFIILYMNRQIGSGESKLEFIVHKYLHIDFYDDDDNDTKLDFWPENKFIELLSQIRYHIAPNPDMINDVYRYWFVPRLDNLIFLKPYIQQHNNNYISFNDIPIIVSHPQIIISYQWDCQRDVICLYKQLTQLGYRVWLNIFQMGGGDSLLDKFNTTIHQSSCLIVCITPKYMKCVHCQYEISLANTLHKPIIPLLFEETDLWPPGDFVLKVFGEKPYIDFRHVQDHDRWSGKQFLLLLGQLQQVLPNFQTDKPRHLLEMQRPTTAFHCTNQNNERTKRVSSAPLIPKSEICSIM